MRITLKIIIQCPLQRIQANVVLNRVKLRFTPNFGDPEVALPNGFVGRAAECVYLAANGRASVAAVTW